MTDFSKIGKRSKRKGRNYEYRVVKLLSEFTGKKFRRVPASGGFNKTGGTVVAEHVFCGDVICDDANFDFSVEAKNRNDISLTALLKDPAKALFTKCWDQCCDDAKSVNKKPMMFFKPNVSDDWVCLSTDDAHSLGLRDAKHFVFNVYDNRPNPFVMDWKQFISVVNNERLFLNVEVPDGVRVS